MINITLRPIYPQEKNVVGQRTGDWVNPREHLDILEKRRLGESQRASGYFREEETG